MATNPRGAAVSGAASPLPAGAQRGEAERSNKPGWTVLELLRWTTTHFAAKGIDTARLDAELLLAFALHCAHRRDYGKYNPQ